MRNQTLYIDELRVTPASTMPWVEAAVRSAFQLEEDLRHAAERDHAFAIVATPGITDLERMARVYEWSVWFWQYPDLDGDAEGLMGDMTVVLTELNPSLLSNNDGKFNIFAHTSVECTGFKRKFRENGNQVRHATASIQACLSKGLLGFQLMQLRESAGTADYRLNIACRDLAAGLETGGPGWEARNIGAILRRDLGDPAQTAKWTGPADGDPDPP
jgi:hypothetical protein